jgi:hypothetical protein
MTILFVGHQSDHKAITVDINLNRKVKKSVKCMGYNYKKGDFNSLCATLTCLPLLDIVEKESDINTTWAKWKDLFLTAFDSFIWKSNVKRSYKPPYITQVIIRQVLPLFLCLFPIRIISSLLLYQQKLVIFY